MLLIIDKSQKSARTVLDLFHFMGVLCTAVTPEYASREISNRYRAVLISNPETLNSCDELIQSINTYSLGAPIFALCRDKEQFISENRKTAFDGVFSSDASSSMIFDKITDYQKKRKLPIIGDYKVAGIDASVQNSDITYFDTPIPFTKTEGMILKFLIRAYPASASAKDILKYSFRPSRCPELQSIRTHISVMNKKFSGITSKNLIVSDRGRGYSIMTPELAKIISSKQ